MMYDVLASRNFTGGGATSFSINKCKSTLRSKQHPLTYYESIIA